MARVTLDESLRREEAGAARCGRRGASPESSCSLCSTSYAQQKKPSRWSKRAGGLRRGRRDARGGTRTRNGEGVPRNGCNYEQALDPQSDWRTGTRAESPDMPPRPVSAERERKGDKRERARRGPVHGLEGTRRGGG